MRPFLMAFAATLASSTFALAEPRGRGQGFAFADLVDRLPKNVAATALPKGTVTCKPVELSPFHLHLSRSFPNPQI
jgi:hypothetical protein